MEQAINKIKSEMNVNPDNPYIQVVGQFLLDRIRTHPADAEKILNTEKTILKSLNEMKKFAEKKKVGNCAVLTDQEGFEIVLKYYGIDSEASTAPVRSSDDTFDIKLEDLL